MWCPTCPQGEWDYVERKAALDTAEMWTTRATRLQDRYIASATAKVPPMTETKAASQWAAPVVSKRACAPESK